MMLNNYFIGMDIGGTNIRIALMKHTGEKIGTIFRFSFKRAHSAIDEIEENIYLPVIHFLEMRGINLNQLWGIGISLAALFNRENGQITKWPNNRLWDSFPLRSYLEERFQIPVIMEDDANSAALGEHLLGAGRGFSDFAYLTIGTGIGCGMILNDNLYLGSRGVAGEIGHIRVVEDGPLCTCGTTGCLQALVSGPALYKKYINSVSPLGFETDQIKDFNKVAELAQNGDEVAIQIFEYAGQYLSWMLSNLVMLLDIPLIVIGGGVARAGEILLSPIRSGLDLYMEQFKRDVLVNAADLGDDSGVIGALNLVYQRYNHNDMKRWEDR
ncbi:MAG: hypothetical protein RHS_1228 [Robinsoniella sp. RHS]|uniref:ROK family protein n=1 Tax=Robinsoniella sp. RHS TaxID=1504536 RepID=UPI000658B708|nr:MAG: hypothetical protein RHS_1228 [Robinsoniella sp. RHS]